MEPIIFEQKIADIEPFVYRHRVIIECRLNNPVISKQEFGDFLKRLSSELGMNSHPDLPEPVITSASGHSLDKHNGLEAMLFWLESGLHSYWWENYQLLTLDMHSCAFLDPKIVHNLIGQFFEIVEIRCFDLIPHSTKMDSLKVEIRSHDKHDAGVFALEPIAKDEFIAGFYGEVYEAPDAMSIPAIALNHAAQFAEHKYRDALPNGVAKYLNHSCVPNCGIRGLHDLVAMRDIQAGEELCWDYAMTEDSNWQVPGGKCSCGSSKCRGRIVPYRDLSALERQQYQGYTSAWLKRKYA
jgi:uncharacterized protein